MSAYKPDQILGHADECDGIEEYDNRLPEWWLGLFYFTIIFGVSYAIHYHFIADRSQAGAYEAEIAAAAQRWPQPEAGEALVMTADAVEAGRSIYATNCIGCHGQNLEGGLGPQLTDDEWLHGGTLEEINQTITDGVPEKGMLSWGPILGPQRIAQVAAFVYSQGGGEEAKND
ncbi:MAG: cbb3-type cytochrome c oxidase N-terminal domain-containing protein [Myxococcota bacterium]